MFEDNGDAVIINKMQKKGPPQIEGVLQVKVRIISVNDKMEFSRTKRHNHFEIADAAKFLLNFHTERPDLNVDVPRIDASILHELVISYFGTNVNTMLQKIILGAETQELINAQNANNAKYDVSFFEAIALQNIK